MRRLTYRPLAGMSIERACYHAAAVSKCSHALVTFTFNDMTLVASPKKSEDTLIWEWEMNQSMAASRYRMSKEGRLNAFYAEKRIETYQNVITSLVNDLPECTDNMDVLMRWTNEYTCNADLVGVDHLGAKVIEILEKAGFTRSAHVGLPREAFNDRRVTGEYIVGQVLSCLHMGMPPHPVAMTFVERYFALPSSEPVSPRLPEPAGAGGNLGHAPAAAPAEPGTAAPAAEA